MTIAWGRRHAQVETALGELTLVAEEGALTGLYFHGIGISGDLDVWHSRGGDSGTRCSCGPRSSSTTISPVSDRRLTCGRVREARSSRGRCGRCSRRSHMEPRRATVLSLSDWATGGWRGGWDMRSDRTRSASSSRAIEWWVRTAPLRGQRKQWLWNSERTIDRNAIARNSPTYCAGAPAYGGALGVQVRVGAPISSTGRSREPTSGCVK